MFDYSQGGAGEYISEAEAKEILWKPDWAKKEKRVSDYGPNLNGVSAYQTLVERKNWLRERIIAKKNVGWDTEYDQREVDALYWALSKLGGSCGV